MANKAKKTIFAEYLYSGPTTSATLTEAGEGGAILFEGALVNGSTVELPVEHKSTKGWLARKYLTLAPATSNVVANNSDEGDK